MLPNEINNLIMMISTVDRYIRVFKNMNSVIQEIRPIRTEISVHKDQIRKHMDMFNKSMNKMQ